MKIAVAGLGRMGMQIARKLHDGGHEVIAHNRSPQKVDQAVSFGAIGAKKKPEVIDRFGRQTAVLWLMISSDAVDQEIAEWLKLLPKNSILIDGGNSDYRLSKKRAETIGSKARFMDVGTSGGILGFKNGFSMMAGGNKEAYLEIEPVLESLSKPGGGYQYFGPSGSGHYVKMVHNAIEYGMMESLAEGYQMLKEGPFENLDLASAGQVWQQASVIESTLNKLAAEALQQNPTLEGIEGVVAETGETRWTLEAAHERNIEMPAIEASFDVRLKSQKGEVNFATKLLAAIRNKFGGHQINPE